MLKHASFYSLLHLPVYFSVLLHNSLNVVMIPLNYKHPNVKMVNSILYKLQKGPILCVHTFSFLITMYITQAHTKRHIHT